MKALAIVLVLAATVTAQELAPPDDLTANVRDIAALSVRNSESIESLKAKVTSLVADVGSIRSRLDILEAKVFEVPTPAPVVTITEPVTIWQPETIPVQAPQVISTKTVTRGRTGPIRGFFRRLFSRNMTVSNSSRSGWIYPPPGQDIYSHLEGPPHYLSNARSLSYDQAMTLHTQLH